MEYLKICEAANVTLGGKITDAITKAENALKAAVSTLETKLGEEVARLQNQINSNICYTTTLTKRKLLLVFCSKQMFLFALGNNSGEYKNGGIYVYGYLL